MESERKTIIYVDDIHFSLVTLRDRLKKYYEIFFAHSVERMFEILDNFTERKHSNPDLILLDLNMPEVDGFEAIRELKGETRYSDIPVIFLSSENDRNIMAMALNHGAADFVTKPFSDSHLIGCIEYQLDPSANDTNRPIILAVDDNPGVLKSVKRILEERYKVYLLREPQEIKAFLKKISPDLFLLDCSMPGLNGFDLVPIIREFAGHNETPVIYLTAEGAVDSLSAAFYFGTSDFIVKPIDEKILHEKTSANLKNHVMRRLLRAQ